MPELTAHQRYATLKQIGVALWVPRKRLSGAAPSQQCDWPEPAVKVSSKKKLQAELQTPALAPTRKLADLPAKAAAPATPAPTPAVQKVAMTKAGAPAAPVSLDIWMLANGWQVVLDQKAEQALAQAHLNLLQNLLRALYPGGLGLISQHRFNWPLPGVPLDTGDLDELRSSLRAFLHGPQFQQPAVALLTFGEPLQQLLPEAYLPEAYNAPTLTQLLHEPQAKRDFWQKAGESGLRARFASSPLLF